MNGYSFNTGFTYDLKKDLQELISKGCSDEVVRDFCNRNKLQLEEVEEYVKFCRESGCCNG